MAGFKNGGLYLKKKATIANSGTDHITVFAKNDGKVYAVDENGVERLLDNEVSLGLVTSISGDLQTQITDLETDVASISGDYVSKAGDSMSGQLTITNPPIALQVFGGSSSDAAIDVHAVSNSAELIHGHNANGDIIFRVDTDSSSGAQLFLYDNDGATARFSHDGNAATIRGKTTIYVDGPSVPFELIREDSASWNIKASSLGGNIVGWDFSGSGGLGETAFAGVANNGTYEGAKLTINGSGGDGLTIQKNTGDAYFTQDVNVPTGNLSVGQDLSVNGNAIISGNLTVQGTTTTIDSAQVLVEDNIITLNSNVTGGPPSLDSGIEVLRGNEATAQFLWDEGIDAWTIGTSGALYTVLDTNNFVSLTGPTLDGTYVNESGDTMNGALNIVTVGSNSLSITGGTDGIAAVDIFASENSAEIIHGHNVDGTEVFNINTNPGGDGFFVVYESNGSTRRIEAGTDLVSDIPVIFNEGTVTIGDEVFIGQSQGVTDSGYIEFNTNGGNTDRRGIIGSNGIDLLLGSVANPDIVTIEDDPNDIVIIKSGFSLDVGNTVSVGSLSPATSGNLLTWDENGTLVDAGRGLSLGGTKTCSVGTQTYNISYGQTFSDTPDPQVTLTVPSGSSDLYVQGVYDKSTTGFSVALSNTPDVSGYEINWLVGSISDPIDVSGVGEDVNQKSIPVAGGLSPAISGADLSFFETADGMFSDSLDFAVGERSFFNFVMPDSYTASTDISVELHITADTTGTGNFEVKIGSKGNGSDYNATTSATAVSDSQNVAVAEQVYKKLVTVPSSNHSVNPGDVVIIGITRTGGTISGDMKVIGCQIKW